MTKYLLATLAVLMFAMSAHAGRSFPQNAQVGELRGIQNPHVQIDGNVYRITPATRIFDAGNRIVVPNSAPVAGAVAFQLDGQGFLSKLWFLTPQEAEAVTSGQGVSRLK